MKHITFKSLIYALFSIIILGSCQNEAIEIQEQVKIIISPSQVLESFIPYKATDLEMENDEELGTARLRITALIYDSKGELYSKNVGLLNDYNSDYSFNILLNPNEEYKLLAFSSSIMGNLENTTAESYKFSGENNLNTLEVVQTNEYSWYSNYSVLGILDNELTAGNDDNMKFNLKPATAYVNLNWRNIHTLHNSNSDSIYGNYTASTMDFYGNRYSWEITLVPGEDANEVIINNLSPKLSDVGFTSEEGVNFYSGYISGDKLIIPTGQDTGVIDADIYSIYLLGVNEDTFEEEDIIMSIDRVNKTLTTENMWGTYSDKNDGGFYELFESGVKFTSSDVGFEYDKYYIIYHNNDIVKYRDNDFVYSTSLDTTQNNGDSITPSNQVNSINIYSVCNLLPGTFDVFARTFIGNESADYGRQSITVKSGQQYVFMFDCASLGLDISLGQLKSALWNNGEYSKQRFIKSGSFINYYHPEKLNITKIEF